MSRKQRIQAGLEQSLVPAHLEVIDESHRHSVPKGSESHFKVIIVSPQFDGQPLIARHRLVNRTVADELGTGLHALAIHAWTPAEWAAKDGVVPDSPPCRGGSKAAAG